MNLHQSEWPAPYFGLITFSDNEYAKIIDDFPNKITPQFQSAVPQHGVMHHIPTIGPPLHAHTRRLPPDKLLHTKEEFRKMEGGYGHSASLRQPVGISATHGYKIIRRLEALLGAV